MIRTVIRTGKPKAFKRHGHFFRKTALIITSISLTAALALPRGVALNPEGDELYRDSSRFVCSGPENESEKSMPIRIHLKQENKIVTLTLEELTIGSLYAEMSSSSPSQALIAQAVAIRSYCLYRKNYRSAAHPDCDICDDYTHCMGYVPNDEIIRRNGDEEGEKIIRRLSDIVSSCSGEYLSYEGKYVNAMFHDSSSGRTESYEELYGNDIPYLRCVDTPEKSGDSSFSMSIESLGEKLFPDKSQIDPFYPVIGNIEYSRDSGRVLYMTVYGKRFDGNTVRFALSLPSTCFRVESRNGRIIFISSGSGHGVGMSQKGAKEMAKKGYDYRQILAHYYPGTVLENCNK